MCKIVIPDGASEIIKTLKAGGFDAYVVGGCVRDSLLGKMPKDWDICTSATPDEMKYLFHEQKILETGLKHGTLTIKSCDNYYEVTTFRTDGLYSDGRHPDTVSFVQNVHDDLSRRDFTINAIAYNDDTGLIDPFGGQEDLGRMLVRCVGNPDDRFQEDALRIMRALRFASVLNFGIEQNTEVSIHRNVGLLENIASERITSELCKMLKGCGIVLADILMGFSDVITEIIPELKPCVGFEQNNKFHHLTVYDHMVYAVSQTSIDDDVVNLTLLLHDIGKPCCYTEDENGGHFHGHGVHSRDLAEKAISHLRLDSKTRDNVLELVLFHDSTIEPTPKCIRRWLNKIGAEQFNRLLTVRIADVLSHRPGTQESRVRKWASICDMFKEVQMDCFSVKDLKINGRDVMSLGIEEGKAVGVILNELLRMVIDGEVENDKNILMDFAASMVMSVKD